MQKYILQDICMQMLLRASTDFAYREELLTVVCSNSKTITRTSVKMNQTKYMD